MKNFLLLSFLFISTLCYSQVEVYVLDVGAGLCTVLKLPNGEVIVYDCGSLESQKKGIDEIKKRLPEVLSINSDIDLLILSHTDADHINSTEFLFNNYNIKKILWTSYSKEDYTEYEDQDTRTYKALVANIKKEDCEVVDLLEQDSIIPPGLEEPHGEVIIRYLSGFNKPLNTWEKMQGNHWRPQGFALNAVSITMQLEYKGKSIFFGGDAVGWLDNKLSATDKYILENIPNSNILNSDVIIVPHHGSWNGISKELIEAVNPIYAIFTAGHKHNHPSKTTVDRFIKYNPSIILMRTDRGDNEGKDEFKDVYDDEIERIDEVGDDEIHITISEDSELICKYRDRR